MARRNLTIHPATPATEPIAECVVTRDRLKLAARRLFAQRGIDGVTVRDIVAASGQRNAASIFYYFGTKEALVQELITDGAKRIDDRRNAAFDSLELRATSPPLRTVIAAVVRTSFNEPDDPREPASEQTYLRFLVMMQASHRELILKALDQYWSRGLHRALAHIRRLLPRIAPTILTQRLVFMSVYVGHVLAAREAVLADPDRQASSLRGDMAIENLIDTLVAMLSVAPGRTTLKTLSASTAAPVRPRRQRA